ncbi:hypothetical protein F4821DRAFT_277198 [Hypoxylon rubiginosum]|uniref:Uncharacterized protein n=1 Tax=Hypoxylon rubiginosum TaxID=110542 RepID=A0ACC0D6X8_9PEZI|nr:hypothetical protein F4821DRAFT_277198 [Hypoxylon rubiginosum]
MKSILARVTIAAVAVTQIRNAAASLDGHLVSSTSDDIPTISTTIQGTSLTGTGSATATSTLTASNSTTSITSTPTVLTSPFMNITSTGTLTETLGGISPSVTISGSLTESPTTTSPNAAATPANIGVGVLAGVAGIVAAVL